MTNEERIRVAAQTKAINDDHVGTSLGSGPILKEGLLMNEYEVRSLVDNTDDEGLALWLRGAIK